VITTAYFWISFLLVTQSFQIPASFPILVDPTTTGRPFVTNSEEELRFLKLVEEVRIISGLLSSYSTFAGVCRVYLDQGRDCDHRM
jgi:hypothetical protein